MDDGIVFRKTLKRRMYFSRKIQYSIDQILTLNDLDRFARDFRVT